MTSAEAKHAARKRVLYSYVHEVGRVAKVTGEVIKRSAIATVGGTVYQNGPNKKRRGGLAEMMFPLTFTDARHEYIARTAPHPLRRGWPLIATADVVRNITASAGVITLLAHNEAFPLVAAGTTAIVLATNFGIILAGEVTNRRNKNQQLRR